MLGLDGKRKGNLSCPHLLLASMITAGENKASAVIMDCRDEPGKDKWKAHCETWYYGADPSSARMTSWVLVTAATFCMA
jgi:hypothetical protein